MLIVTTDTIPGKKIKKVFGVVLGDNTLKSKGLMDTLKEREVSMDNRMLDEITLKAKAIGANAVVGFHISVCTATIQGCGTAVLIEDEATPLREETLVMQPDVDPNGDDTRVNKPA